MGNATQATRIGAWRRSPDGARYERVPDADDRWASLAGFSRVPEKRRVLFFGESAARGLFYDPLVTPAAMLTAFLSAGGEPIEVLDLARTGARVHNVVALAESATALSPEAVVVFAGNNWKYELTDEPGSAARDADALRHAGVAGLLRQRERALADVARRFVDRICRVFADIAPLVFVLPESNLLDWHVTDLSPVFGNGGELSWHRLVARMRDACRDSDWDRVIECCDALHEMDGGVSGEPFRARARALLARGRTQEALAAFRRARDVRLWYDSVDPAWLPSAGVEAARVAASEQGALVVDLPELLPGHAERGVPDGSLFLDWCHLSSRGLRLVARAIGASVADILGVPAGREEQNDAIPAPSPETEAGARFCAAIVNSHWGQPLETIRAHAEAATRAWPGIVTAMERYCADRGGPAPWWMRPKLSELANISKFESAMLTGRQGFDEDLVDSFNSRLREIRGTQDDRTGTRREGALVPGVRTSLFNPLLVASWRPLDWMGLLGGVRSKLMGASSSHRHYYRAHSESSRFLFVIRSPAEMVLELVTRIGTPGTGRAEVLVNGTQAGGIDLSERWQRTEFLVPAALLSAGANHLEIRWRRESLRTPPLTVLADRLARGLPQELSTVFGEIYAMHATLSRKAEKPRRTEDAEVVVVARG